MFKITGLEGFDDLSRKLNDLSDRAKELDGKHNVPLPDLLPPTFLSDCSRFSSADELFEARGFKIESAEDFTAIPDDQWNAFIQGNTRYANWDEMLSAAGAAWMATQLGLSA